MRVFCTNCSASKDPAKGRIPAFKRYISARIVRVQEMAEQANAQVCILSGQFGLVDWDQPLPWYDHLLQADEVESLAQMVAQQILAKSIAQIDYYTVSPQRDSQLVPYLNTIESACNHAGIRLYIYTLEEPKFTPSIRNWKQIMEAAAGARQVLLIDRAQGEADFHKLSSLFPDDGMIYFEQGNGYVALGELRLAKANLEHAKQLFPLERWQWEAQEALNRVEQQLAEGGTLAEAQRRLGQMNKVDPALRQPASAAIDKASTQPANAGNDLRKCLEMIIDRAMRLHHLTPGGDLYTNIRILKGEPFVSEVITNHMDNIRILGDKASHAKKPGQPQMQAMDIYPMVTALIAILDWWNSQQP